MANDFVQVMTDGQEDAKTLSVVVNGDEQTQVETRLGETYPSVKKAIKVMTQAGVGFTPFESKNLMTLSDLVNGAYAIVTNDTADNNGLYFKKSTGWVKVTWDIDERQKEYANEVASTALSTAASDATTKANDAKTQAVAIATDLASDDATSKADAAQAAAAIDANVKANDAKTQAVAIATDLASDDATSKADAAQAAAAIDANVKANDAKTQAVAIATDLSAVDASAKANAAKELAISTAYSNDRSIKGFASNIGRYELADYYSDLGEGGQKLSLYTSFDDSVIAPVVATLNDTQVYIDLDITNKSLIMIWRHTPTRLMQTVWQPNGFNNLFNFKSISYSDNSSLFNSEWVSIQDITTDYIPPLTFKATTQPLTETGVSTAGGNHSANGAKTADMTACQFYIDGKLVTADFKGVVDRVQVRWTNKIFAPNTVVEQRYTIQQDVLAEFSHAHIAVTVKTTALEPVNITYEGGTQMYAKGWLDATSFYGGAVKGFTPNVTEYIDAGTKSVAPDAWAVVVKSNDLGYFASYLDRGFGVKTDLIPPDGVMAARNNGTIPKYYNFTIRNQVLNAGDTYLWRGGYAYAPLSITNLESAFLAQLGGKDAIGYEALIGQKGEIKLPNQLIGKDFAQLSSSPTGVYVNATQYQTSLSKEV